MASKQDLKRQIKYMIYDVIDECYFVCDMQPEKAEEAEKTIDAAVDFHESILPAISRAKTKADFKPIIDKVNAKQREFVEQLNSLN